MKRKYEMRGVGVVTATPRTASGDINEEEMRRHVAFLADSGISFIQPCAATGQGLSLSERQYAQVLEACVDEVGDRIFITAYSGRDSTAETIRLTKLAMDVGADAAWVIQPYWSLPSEEGLYLHFSAIAEAVPGFPLVFYNNAARGGVNLSLSVMKRLSNEYDSFVGLKQSDLTQLVDSYAELGDKVTVFAKSEKELLAGLALGASGGLTFAGNIAPRHLVRMFEQWSLGDVAGARTSFFRLYPLMDAVHLQPVPAVVHYILNHCGWDFGEVCLPIAPPSLRTRETVDRLLAENPGLFERP